MAKIIHQQPGRASVMTDACMMAARRSTDLTFKTYNCTTWLLACVTQWSAVELGREKRPQNVESDLQINTIRLLHGTPPSASFLHPMYYSYNLLTLPKYKSVKLFLCVDSQGAWSLVSCLKPIRKCGYDWGCPWGLFLDGFLYYTNILDWLSQPNSWRSNWYSTRKCN